MKVPDYIHEYCKQLLAIRPRCVDRIEVTISKALSVVLGDFNEINILFESGGLISLHSVDGTAGNEVGPAYVGHPHWPDVFAGLKSINKKMSDIIEAEKNNLDKTQNQLSALLKIEEPVKQSDVGRSVQYWEKSKHDGLCQPRAAIVLYQDFYGACTLRLLASRYGYDKNKDDVYQWKGDLNNWRDCPFDCFWKAAP